MSANIHPAEVSPSKSPNSYKSRGLLCGVRGALTFQWSKAVDQTYYLQIVSFLADGFHLCEWSE